MQTTAESAPLASWSVVVVVEKVGAAVGAAVAVVVVVEAEGAAVGAAVALRMVVVVKFLSSSLAASLAPAPQWIRPCAFARSAAP
jgi:hypothetical protein